MQKDELFELISYLRRKDSCKYKKLPEPQMPKNFPFKNIDATLMEPDLIYLKTTILAMANTDGGIIIIGAKKERPNNYDEYKQKVLEQMQSLIPIPHIEFDTYLYRDKLTLIITVSRLELLQLPCHIKNRPPSHSKIRINGKNEKIPETYVHGLENILDNGQKDECVKQNKYNVKYTDQYLLSDFSKKYNKYHKLINLSKNQIKAFINYKTRGHTLGYILSFSVYPQIYYPYLYIRIYYDETGEYEIIDGNIFHMYKYTMMHLQTHLGYKLVVTKRQIFKRTCPYHLGILGELLYNALIHRDYSYYTHSIPIEVIVNAESIVITNPGYSFLPIRSLIEGSILIKNKNLKMTNDILIYKDKPHHGFKYIKRAAKLSNTLFPLIKVSNGIFMAELRKIQSSIYKEPYTVSNILKFCIEPKTKLEIYQHFFNTLGKNYKYCYKKYILRLINTGALVFTVPNKPESKHQKLKTKEEYLEYLE